jgi:hypothetical protein
MGPSSVAFPVDPPDGSVTGSSWQAFRRPLTDGAAWGLCIEVQKNTLRSGCKSEKTQSSTDKFFYDPGGTGPIPK